MQLLLCVLDHIVCLSPFYLSYDNILLFEETVDDDGNDKGTVFYNFV